MVKRVCALLLAVMMLLSLAACGGEKSNGQVLDAGWVVRGDANGVGEAEGWQKGFTKANEETADVVWYSNTFTAHLVDGERVVLSLCDLGESATVWLNGKQVDAREDVMGDYLVDVTDTAKRNGTNKLVIRAGVDAAVELTGLSVRPAVMISDLAASANYETKTVDVVVTLDNTKTTGEVTLTATVTALDTGKVLTRIPMTVQAGAGESEHTFLLAIPDAIGWNYDNPYLYNLTVSAVAGNEIDTAYETVGFKTLTQDAEGVYALNGKNFFLRIVDLPESVMKNNKTMRYFVDYVRTAEYNAIYPLGNPTQALLDYADATGMMVVTDASSDSKVIGTDAHVSPITVDLSAVDAIGADLQFPAEQPLTLTDTWYTDMNLSRLYGSAVDAYKAAGNLHAKQLNDAIAKARLTNANAIRVSGAIAGYPDVMLETMADAIEELRYVIQADPVVVSGGNLKLKIDLVDHDILWKGKTFKAYVKVTGKTGILWENTISFKTEISELGHSSRLIPLVDEIIPIHAPAGQYIIAVELTDLAHPVCGEADLYVVDAADLSGATIVNGMLTADAKAKAEAGGKVIVLGATAESGLPIDGQFVDGITGAAVDSRVKAAFAGSMISSDFNGMSFTKAFVADGGTTVLSGFGFTQDGGLVYGDLIATYPVGSGSITVVTADVDLNNPAAAALLAAAIA